MTAPQGAPEPSALRNPPGDGADAPSARPHPCRARFLTGLRWLPHATATPSVGKAAAIAYTLIQTARLNGVDPQAWLAQVLGRIPDYKINRVDDLLPWNTAPAEDRQADA